MVNENNCHSFNHWTFSVQLATILGNLLIDLSAWLGLVWLMVFNATFNNILLKISLELCRNIQNKSGSSWSWSYCSWIYNYLFNQCLSPLKLWVRTPVLGEVYSIHIHVYGIFFLFVSHFVVLNVIETKQDSAIGLR
jgi:hypothetical protein